MIANSPTPQQTLFLWRILGSKDAVGEVMQKDLGVKVLASDRNQLVKLGLLDVTKGRNGAVKLTVTDAGWGWANEHLNATLPERTSARMAPLLQAWLARFHSYLQLRNASLADVFISKRQNKGQTAESQNLGKADVEDERARIRAAYLSLTGGQLKTRCLLRDLRGQLIDFARERLDSAIHRMVGSGEAILFRLDNRIEITPADSAAAIFSGGEQRHILWIDR